MSLDEDLLRDLESDSDFEESDKEELVAENEVNQERKQDADGDIPMDKVTSQLHELVDAGKEVTTSDLLSRIDLSSIKDVTKISKLSHKVDPIIATIEKYTFQKVSKKEEYNFLITVNDLSVEITNEISLVHDFIKAHYRKRFPRTRITNTKCN
ncbi:unnamed protein product [Wickerhamomyces anomalus]